MLSKSFSTQLRKAGQQFRSGVLGEAITETYKDADAAFKLLETATGYGWAPCRLAFVTAEETTFAGGAPDAVDGVTTAVGDRILVTAQTTDSKNGIYVVTDLGAGVNDATWERATDLNATAEVAYGYKVRVLYGTVYKYTDWVVSASPATLGTDTLTFVTIAASGATVMLKTLYDAHTILISTLADDPAPLTVGTNTFVGRAAGNISAIAVAATTLLGRTTAGNLAALAPADARGVLLTSSVAHTAEMLGAGTVGADRLAAGAAAEGVNAGDVQFSGAVATGGTFAPLLSGIVLCQDVTIAAGPATTSLTTGQKIKILGFEFQHTDAGGGAGKTIQLTNGADAAITEAIVQTATANFVDKATTLVLANSVITAGAASLKVVTANAASVAGVARIYYVAVA